MAHPRSPYLMTAYLERLLEDGIRTEERFVADASRFVRYMLARAGPADVEAFLEATTRSPRYRQRLRASLARFFRFLEIPGLPEP